MLIKAQDLTILIPVYGSEKSQFVTLIDQLKLVNNLPRLYFVYEKDTCNFDLESWLHNCIYGTKIDYKLEIAEGKKGIGYALNLGVLKISSSYILRHDLGDDFFPNRIDVTLAAINAEKDVDIFYTQAILHRGGFDKISNYPLTQKSLTRRFAHSNSICHPTVAFKRSSILNIGNYDATLRFCEDLDLWLRALSMKLEMRCIDVPTIRYYLPTSGRSHENWKVNLDVRVKNLGSPNWITSLSGILISFAFLTLPTRIKRKIYSYVR